MSHRHADPAEGTQVLLFLRASLLIFMQQAQQGVAQTVTTREARRPGKGAPSRSPRGSSEAFSEVLSGRWGDVCAEPTLNVGPFHAHLLRALPGAPGALAEARPCEASPWATATGQGVERPAVHKSSGARPFALPSPGRSCPARFSLFCVWCFPGIRRKMSTSLLWLPDVLRD